MVTPTPKTQPSPDPAYVREVLDRLQQTYPDAHCELDYETPVQLLTAVILSAQCTDVRVNKVTPALFERYPTVEALAAADPAELEEIIHSTGFYHSKARYIHQSAQMLLLEYGGQLPDDMKELQRLPGVARKTANVVMGEVYGKADGITVDTHVKRLAGRLGLTAETDPVKVERDLMAIIPRERWIDLSHQLIWHGRRVCKARQPDCTHCRLNDICPSAELFVAG